MFSVEGRLVTDFRYNLKPENTSMLVFVSQNYTRVSSNLKDWEKTCEGEQYELPRVTPPPPPPPAPEKAQQQGKSITKAQTQSQLKTKKRDAPEKASPTQMPETQTGPEPEEQQQLQLDTQESQGTPVHKKGLKGLKVRPNKKSLFVDSNGTPTKTK